MKNVKTIASLAIFGAIMGYFVWASLLSSGANPVSEEQVAAVYASLPTPPGSRLEGHVSSSARKGLIEVGRAFNTDQPAEHVRAFYNGYFQSAGWHKKLDDKSRGILVYCKSGIAAAVYFPRRNGDGFSLSATWASTTSFDLHCE